jgi:hypothetical protein
VERENNREQSRINNPSVPLPRPISISQTSTVHHHRPLTSSATITSSPPRLVATSLSSPSHFFLPLSLFLNNMHPSELRICPLVNGDPPVAWLGVIRATAVPCYGGLINGRGGAWRPIGEGHRSTMRLNEYDIITAIDGSCRVLTEGS